MSAPATSLDEAIHTALSTVQDPEIHRPITELRMVSRVSVRPDGVAELGILLTVAGCPMRDKLRTDITAAVSAVPGGAGVEIEFGVMSPEQRKELQASVRGPMLHRALQQFLADVYCGDLDVLLLDLPPGTGDVAISLAQLLPSAEILVVTTPQMAAAEVAERAGAISLQTHQRLVGVIENMSWLELPTGERMEIFGAGGGQAVADSLTRLIGAQVPLLGQVPLDTRVREAGDAGTPVVLSDPDAPAAAALRAVADRLAVRRESLLGKPLGLRPAR